MDCYFYLSLLDMDRHTTPDRNRLRRPARELPVDPISSVYRSSVRGMIIQPFASQNDSLIIKLFHTFAFRVASMPNTGVEEEYYRLRHFSITGKGIVNRGDSLKSRRSRSNNSVASSNSRLVNERERKDFSLFAYFAWKLLMFFFYSIARLLSYFFCCIQSSSHHQASSSVASINLKWLLIVDCSKAPNNQPRVNIWWAGRWKSFNESIFLRVETFEPFRLFAFKAALRERNLVSESTNTELLSRLLWGRFN